MDTKISAEQVLTLFLVMLLSGCHANTKSNYKIEKVELYRDTKYSAAPFFIDLVGGNDEMAFCNLIDPTRNPLFFETELLFTYDLKTNTYKQYEITEKTRVIDFTVLNDSVYYLKYFWVEDNPEWVLSQYVDGKNDHILLSGQNQEVYEPPELIEYNDTYYLLNNVGSKTEIYEFQDKAMRLQNKLETNGGTIALARIRDNQLYIPAGTLIYRYDLTSHEGEKYLISETPISRFTVTDHYVLLSGERNIVYDHDGSKVRELEKGSISWIESLVADEIVYTDDFNNIVYMNLNNEQSIRITADTEEVLELFANKFLIVNNEIVFDGSAIETDGSTSENVLHRITFF